MTGAELLNLPRPRAWWDVPTDDEWAAAAVSTFPASWASRLLSRWAERHRIDRRAANLAHLGRCVAIARAQRAGVKPDANDAELCEEADRSARDAARRLRHVQGQARATLADRDPVHADRLAMLGQLGAALEWLADLGIADELRRAAARSIPGALRRLVCARWWRRILRRVHARAVESTARSLGLVHRHAGCYVSDDALARRRGQLARNAAALESVSAVNDCGQDYTLAQLAATGPGNRAIRRAELMTRIAGFELIARECGHVAFFVTVTCPSRMHAQRITASGRVEANPRHDGTTPDEGQRHLSRQWARARAAADRAGLEWYGFRIAEPNHDATPHWHALMFMPERTTRGRPSVRVLVRLLRRYFWRQVDPDEPGARRHRVKVARIDWSRGSAAGYVAKYVAKNIDGMHVGADLYGNPALESSARVEAWAATWRIRQFQQLGGAPVGVWRELRRVHPEQESAAPAVALALDAVNITASAAEHHSDLVERYTAATGWATYTHLQGGTRVRRELLRVRLLREAQAGLGRYGEPLPARPVGVQTIDARRERLPAFGIVGPTLVSRRVPVAVESERARWVIVPRASIDAARLSFSGEGEAFAPRTRVDNCTDPAPTGNPYTEPTRPERRARLRKWVNWNRGRANQRDQHAADRPPDRPPDRTSHRHH